jgi:hypothetical protein
VALKNIFEVPYLQIPLVSITNLISLNYPISHCSGRQINALKWRDYCKSSIDAIGERLIFSSLFLETGENCVEIKAILKEVSLYG